MDRVWLASYPPGMPAEVAQPPFKSVRDLIENSFRQYPKQPAFMSMGTTLSYAELDELSMRFAAYLKNTLGLVRGERLAIMLPNLLQYPVVMFGAFRAGLVVVNVNPLYTARELKHQLTDSGAKAIVILENFAHTLEAVIAQTAVEQTIVTGVGDLLSWPRRHIVNVLVRTIRRAVPGYRLPGHHGFRQALAMADGEVGRIELGYADIAYLQYTGGTTGVAKGAMLSHRNMVYNVQQIITWQGEAYAGVEPIAAVTALPLYHIFSLQANCLSTVAQGGLNLLIANPRDLPAVVKLLQKHRFNAITGVNTLFAALLNTPGFDKVDFSQLRMTIGGGMAVQPAVAQRWQAVTGRPIYQGYGLTETSPVATSNLPGSEFTGSIGLPLPSTDLMIADDAGNPLGIDEVGEICIRGPQVMEGYWQRPADTAEVMLPGGWLRTGDIGRLDEAGFAYIEDRKKDVIIVSGFNVYPNEIEQVIVEMDGILEAAAIGIADGHSGEAVKVFAVRSSEEVTEEQVMAHCREKLTAYKRPKTVEFRDELAKTNVGKILRRALRDEPSA